MHRRANPAIHEYTYTHSRLSHVCVSYIELLDGPHQLFLCGRLFDGIGDAQPARVAIVWLPFAGRDLYAPRLGRHQTEQIGSRVAARVALLGVLQ